MKTIIFSSGRYFRNLLLVSTYLLGLFGIVATGGGGGSSDDDSDETTKTASITFPAQAQNVSFTAGVPQDFTTVVTIDLGSLGGPLEEATINLTQALSNLTVAVMKPAPLAVTQKPSDWVDNGTYVTDTSTGLEWLKLTETSQYPQLTAQLFIDGDGVGGPFDTFKADGWVIADVQEVRDLLGQLFGSPFPDDQFGYPLTDIQTAFDFFGITDNGSSPFGEGLAVSDLAAPFNPLCQPFYQNSSGIGRAGSFCLPASVGLDDTQADAGFEFGIWANRAGSGPLTPGATVRVYTGLSEEQDDLCNTGTNYQSLTVFLDALNQLASVQPSSYTASQEILDIYNTGSVATCTRVTPNVNMVASMSGLEAEYKTCTKAPGDFDGVWSGTYSCTGSCPDPGGPITLTVNQNGGEATYSDGAASYSGFVCGDVFSFRGGNSSYDESGNLTLTGPNSATKTSFFRESPTCSGSCTDFLTRP